MDWVYIILSIILFGWSIQMLVDYFRKAQEIHSKMFEATSSQKQVLLDEEEAMQKQTSLIEEREEIETCASQVSQKEKELEEELAGLKRKRR